MEILKTLKDLQEDTTKETSYFTIKHLKEEAKKWYKDLEATEPYQELKGHEAVKMWIRVFFNLGDDDIEKND